MPGTEIALSGHGWAVALFAVLVFACFVWDRWPIGTVSLFVLAILPAGFAIFPLQSPSGVVSPAVFLAGLGSPALVTICALMVIGHALVVTGAMEPVARKLAIALEHQPVVGLLLLLVVPGLASGIFNDTPLVVLLIPLILAGCERAGRDAAHYLLPMNYAVLIGGMATTIGTSTNLIVVALSADAGGPVIGMFDFYPLVLTAALPALAYLWLVAPRLLSRAKAPSARLVEPVFDAEFHISAGGKLEGKQLRNVLPALAGSLQLVALKRGARILARLPSVTLRAGDRLIIQGRVHDLKAAESELGAPLYGNDVAADMDESGAKSAEVEPIVVAQLILGASSPLVDKTVREVRIADQHGVIVVGVRSAQGRKDWSRDELPNVMLRTGDILLVQGSESDVRDMQAGGLGLLLDARFFQPRRSKAPMALAIMAAVVALSATKLMPIAYASLAGVLALILTRTLSWQEVSTSLSAKVILLVAASLALGEALQVTGVTAYLAAKLAQVSDAMPVWAVIGLLMGVCGVMTNFVSNNAAAAIGTPLALALSKVSGLPPEPLVLAVLFGCNLCYVTPMGYQTNLLVMNAGGYRFGDFVKVGLPLFIIMWASLTALLVQRYSL